MFYSKTTGGFYTEEIHRGAIPEDAVEITADIHAALLQGQSNGFRIVGDADGYPELLPPLPATAEEVSQRIKAERDARRFTGGVQVNGMWFRSDQVATGEYTALMLLGAGLPGNTVLRAGWRTMDDGVVVDMTPDLVGQILAAGFAAAAAIDDAAQAHLLAVAVAEDPAAYDYTGGWPPIFGEV